MINLRDAFNLATATLLKPWIFTKWQSKRLFIKALQSRFLILCSAVTALPLALSASNATFKVIFPLKDSPSVILFWIIAVMNWVWFVVSIISNRDSLMIRELRKKRKHELLTLRKKVSMFNRKSD
jgi:hypothetical protein